MRSTTCRGSNNQFLEEYHSLTAAEMAAEETKRNYGHTLTPAKCRACGYWHLTTVTTRRQCMFCTDRALFLKDIYSTREEALRTAVQADRAGEARTQNALLPPPETHWGPVHLDLGASVALKWTDNVRISQGSQEADFSVRPQVNLGAMLPISRTSRISAGVGIGYEKYFELSQYDTFVITPGSTVALSLIHI